MANPEHLEILKQGVRVWNRWRAENPSILPDLVEAQLARTNLNVVNFNSADLRMANLAGANLSAADLQKANLIEADLRGARLIRTDLRKANLIEATLNRSEITDTNFRWTNLSKASFVETNLTRIDCREANFSKANLCGANLIKVNLNEAILSEAVIGRTTFGDVDLSKALGLDTVHHSAPSEVGINSIFLSKVNLSQRFLQGVGIPDLLISAIDLLPIQAVQYYSCFISYSSSDESFAQRLHADLQQKGVRCWFAPEDMKIGDKIRPTIDQSIRIHDKLLLVLSENSAASQWVEQEVATALERERKQEKKVLFPVRLDETVMKIESGWPALIRNTRHIGDFSQWKDHDTYQAAFERLLRDLKAENL